MADNNNEVVTINFNTTKDRYWKLKSKMVEMRQKTMKECLEALIDEYCSVSPQANEENVQNSGSPLGPVNTISSEAKAIVPSEEDVTDVSQDVTETPTQTTKKRQSMKESEIEDEMYPKKSSKKK